jgi:hypothetical protein
LKMTLAAGPRGEAHNKKMHPSCRSGVSWSQSHAAATG